MVDETKQKIMDAALKLFAEHGYKGATTRAIADESGFNELTLFRKFKNKENLFNQVLAQNINRVKEEIDLRLSANQYEDPDEFLRTLITDVTAVADNNAEFLNLTNTEKSEPAERLKAEFVEQLSRFIEEKIPDKDIDYDAMALSIFANALIISQINHFDQTWFDQDKALEGFIKNVLKAFH
jgi:AcrR family transcriptional regulator